jgi:hypothetical protein
LALTANNSNYPRKKDLKQIICDKRMMGDPSVVTKNIGGFSDWSGLRLTFAGTFTDFKEQNYEAAINI